MFLHLALFRPSLIAGSWPNGANEGYADIIIRGVALWRHIGSALRRNNPFLGILQLQETRDKIEEAIVTNYKTARRYVPPAIAAKADEYPSTLMHLRKSQSHKGPIDGAKSKKETDQKQTTSGIY